MKKELLFFTRGELVLVLVLAISASLFSLLPTIWAYLKTPPDSWFSGFLFLYNPWDVNSYLANIRQGLNGQWLYHNPYTTFSEAALPIFLFYLFLGHLGRIFSLPIPVIYHLVNFILTIIFSLILYFFLAFFLKEKKWQFAALFLILFGGGIGWYLPKVGFADIAFPDGTTFQTLHLPHFILNQIFFLGALLFSFWAFSFKKWRFALIAALLGLGLVFVHPYSLFVVVFILFGYLLLLVLSRKRLNGTVYLIPQVILWLSALLFFYLILRQNLLFAQKAPSPSPFFLFLSYGILAPLAILGAIFFWRSREEKKLFLLAWLVFHFLILYFPISFQRLNMKGFFIILGISAIWGLKSLGSLMKRPWPIYFWFFTFAVFNQLLIAYLLFSYAGGSNRWVYLSSQEKMAFDFLLKNTRKGENVLASYRIGNFLPANTDNRVYIGHDFFVSNPQERREKISSFYAGKMVSSTTLFLKEEKINYVFWGPEEKALGDFDLTKEGYLENIYQNEKVVIFKVK